MAVLSDISDSSDISGHFVGHFSLSDIFSTAVTLSRYMTDAKPVDDHQGHSFWLKICTKLFSGWGFAPDPTGGSSDRSPNPLAGKGRGRRGGEGKGMGMEGREARRVCLLLNLSLDIRPWFACNVCQCKRCGLC